MGKDKHVEKGENAEIDVICIGVLNG